MGSAQSDPLRQAFFCPVLRDLWLVLSSPKTKKMLMNSVMWPNIAKSLSLFVITRRPRILGLKKVRPISRLVRKQRLLWSVNSTPIHFGIYTDAHVTFRLRSSHWKHHKHFCHMPLSPAHSQFVNTTVFLCLGLVGSTSKPREPGRRGREYAFTTPIYMISSSYSL